MGDAEKWGERLFEIAQDLEILGRAKSYSEFVKRNDWEALASCFRAECVEKYERVVEAARAVSHGAFNKTAWNLLEA